MHPLKQHLNEWQSVSRCSVSLPAWTLTWQYGHGSDTLKHFAVCNPSNRLSSLENSLQIGHVFGCGYKNACAARHVFLRFSLLSFSTPDLLVLVRHTGHLMLSFKGKARVAEGNW